ncbi:MAG: PASTA domain-containing protein [Ferruginibacter sp.]
MIRHIKEKPFWVHLLIILVLITVLFFGFLQLLGVITKHGEHLTVPSVTDKPTAEAVKILESKGFEVMIQDSVYTDTARMGIVLKQFPEPFSTVKVNRVVLLTVNRVTLPMVDMPALQGKSLGYAIEILKRSHLVLGDTTYRADFMMGSVLEQRFNSAIISSGAKIPWGSRIDMVIGGGLADDQMMVPSLLGLTYSEAKSVLEMDGIMIGAPIADPDVRDTLNAFVYKQSPPKLTLDKRPVYIRSGQVMDVWISPVMKIIKDSVELNP